MACVEARDRWQDLRTNERVAGCWFARLSGLQPQPHDVGSGPGRRVDFLVFGQGGPVGALEITQHMDRAWRARAVQVDRCDWATPCLSRHWTVCLEEPDDYRCAHSGRNPPHPKEVHRRLPELLGYFERDPRFRDDQGVVTLPMQCRQYVSLALRLHKDDASGFPQPEEWMHRLNELDRLGVSGAFASARPDLAGRIFISCGAAGMVGPSLVTQAVTDEYRENRDKLMRHEGPRHLWLWVADGRFFTEMAMEDDDLPSESPDADGLTDAWVATRAGRVWHWNRDAGWRAARRNIRASGDAVRPDHGSA